MESENNKEEVFKEQAQELINNKKVSLQEFLEKHKGTIKASKDAFVWLIKHIDDIREFLEAIGGIFHSPTERILDLDSLLLFGKPMDMELLNDNQLYELIIFEVADKNNFQAAYSKKYDKYIEII